LASQRFNRWLDRRIPPTRHIRLGQRSIFIFPTATGFGFGGLIVLLLLAAINYQNSLIYGLAFLLGSLFLVTILHTYRNLAGLSVEFTGAERAFVGEDVGYALRVGRPAGSGRTGIQLGAAGLVPRRVSLVQQESCAVTLFVPARHRGWLHPGRFIIETYYPLGLLRAWSWIDVEARALVYPRPLFTDEPVSPRPAADDGALLDPAGSDDFDGLRDYRAGDSVRHILWRAYARSGELVIKQYAGYLDPRLILDWNEVRGSVEERLSRLTAMALAAARADREFALRLPGIEIDAGSGERHLHAVLRTLALYEG
jgi:uncharacterized protein (DUF58 family)